MHAGMCVSGADCVGRAVQEGEGGDAALPWENSGKNHGDRHPQTSNASSLCMYVCS